MVRSYVLPAPLLQIVLHAQFLSALLQTAVNLAEQHGKEGAVSAAYREYVAALDSKELG